MRAATLDRYGTPEVLQIQTVPEPTVGPRDVLVQVHATSVTTADWRFRASAFPPGMWLLGRLVAGVFRPRNRISGREFSGRIVAVGRDVTQYAVGDEVFGVSPHGANAERIAVPESAMIARKPRGLTHAEAVALPFGALSAIHFVRDVAQVRAGDRVLVVGASGGVGVYAVQMAKALGAEVTAVCSAENAPLVRALGADHVIDYRTESPHRTGRTWDVVIDTAGVTKFADYRPCLAPDGRHAFVEGRLLELWQALTTPLRRGPTVRFDVTRETSAALAELVDLVEAGTLRPVIGHRFALDEIVQAHRVVQARHRRGAVVLEVRPEPAAAPLRRVG